MSKASSSTTYLKLNILVRCKTKTLAFYSKQLIALKLKTMIKGWHNVRMLCKLPIVREQEKAGLLQLFSSAVRRQSSKFQLLRLRWSTYLKTIIPNCPVFRYPRCLAVQTAQSFCGTSQMIRKL